MKSTELIVHKKAEVLLNDVYPILRNFPKSEKFALSQEIKQAFYALLRNLMLANNIRSKKAMKRRIKALDKKLKNRDIELCDVLQAVNSWLGHARHSNSYNLCKKIFEPYPYIKIEGDERFGER